MLWKGFRFGMLLQLAIGPVCLFVLQTSAARGFFAAEAAVLGTALTDGTEILLAILGVGTLLRRSAGTRRLLKLFGAGVLFLFGAVSAAGALGFSILPSLPLFNTGGGPFFASILLALSNPLTVLFWAGVFSAKIAEEGMTGKDLNRFGAGCVAATLFFLSLAAAAGAGVRQLLTGQTIRLMNLAVGVMMVWFGIRGLRRREGGG